MLPFKKISLLLSVIAVTVATTAKATLVCNNWSSGGSTSPVVYNCNFSNGSYGGSYVSSYNCFNNNSKDYCTINYTGGGSYQGSCTVVFKCSNGTSYYCNVPNWDGKESIQCDYVPRNCTGVYVCGGSSSNTVAPVPEVSTIVAGAFLLIPLVISTVRIFRKHKAVSAI